MKPPGENREGVFGFAAAWGVWLVVVVGVSELLIDTRGCGLSVGDGLGAFVIEFLHRFRRSGASIAWVEGLRS